jgi:hypothetical protein
MRWCLLTALEPDLQIYELAATSAALQGVGIDRG